MEGKFRKVASTLPGREPGLARGEPLESPVYPKFDDSKSHIERRNTMKMKTVNRKRNRAITVRMNDSEMEILNSKLKKTGITQQAFVIGAIKQAVILPVEGLRTLKDISLTFADLIRQLRGMANNINQLARWAHVTGLIPEKQQLNEISRQIEIYRRESEQIWQSIRSLTTQQKRTEQCEPSSDMSSRTRRSKKAM